jgi:hypothetical protein
MTHTVNIFLLYYLVNWNIKVTITNTSKIASIPTIIAKRGFFSPLALLFLTAFKFGIKLTINNINMMIPKTRLTFYHCSLSFFQYIPKDILQEHQ